MIVGGVLVEKKHRVNMSLTNKQSSNLNRLAVSCNMRPTTLAGLLIKLSLNNVQLVSKLQKEYSYKVERMIEEKGLGGKKIHRVNVSLTNNQSFKLNRLATSCNMKPTTLAALLIEKSLNNTLLINELQNEYCTQKAYRIVPIINKGELNYVLTGREDL